MTGTATTSLVERIARVLCAAEISANADGAETSAGAHVDEHWRSHRNQALAVLHAIREPDAMAALKLTLIAAAVAVPANLLPDITTTNQDQLRDIIRRERRSELALEFQRFFDVIRYGEAYARQALRDQPNFNYARHRFYPIPQSERDTNKALGF